MGYTKSKIKKQLIEVSSQKLTDCYEQLLNWDKSIENKLGFKWHRYIKKCSVDTSNTLINSSDNTVPYTVSISPVYRYVPNLRVKLKNEPILLEDVLSTALSKQIIASDIEHKYSQKISMNDIHRFIYSVLESDEMKIPKEKDVVANVKKNVENLLRYLATTLTRITSIAPVVGCSFDGDIELGGITFRKPTPHDIATVAMIEWNLSGSLTRLNFDYYEPVFVLDHEFDMMPNPNDYSFSESMIRLHSIFKDKSRNALATVRLRSSKRIGFSYIYHLDRIWNTLSSFRFVTEDRSAVYRPLRFGKHSLRRDEFYRPRQTLFKDNVIDTFNKVTRLFQARFANPYYSHLIDALDFYSKSIEEDDFGWALLDVVKGLESICYFRKRQKGETGMCDSAGAINHALAEHSKSDLVKKAYATRSQRVAHSPQSSIEINPNLLQEISELERSTILKVLDEDPER